MVVMNVRSAIVSESTLSFMGIGLPLEIVSWGSMLSLSEKALLTGSWWIILIPGIFLVATLLCMTAIGNDPAQAGESEAKQFITERKKDTCGRRYLFSIQGDFKFVT